MVLERLRPNLTGMEADVAVAYRAAPGKSRGFAIYVSTSMEVCDSELKSWPRTSRYFAFIDRKHNHLYIEQDPKGDFKTTRKKSTGVNGDLLGFLFVLRFPYLTEEKPKAATSCKYEIQGNGRRLKVYLPPWTRDIHNFKA